MNLTTKVPSRVISLVSVLLLSCGGCKEYYGTGLERAVSSFEERSADVVPEEVASVREEAPIGRTAPFVIDQIFEKRKFISHAPWHTEGGSWRVFEAYLTDEPLARFVFGYRSSSPDSPSPQASSRSMEDAFLGCKSVDAGNRFLRGIAEKLGGSLPPLSDADFVGAMRFEAWFKGGNYERLGPGTYRQGKGTWQNVRLFLHHEGEAGDLAMGINLASKEGEFVEFEQRGRDRVNVVLAAALRGAPFPHGGAISELASGNAPIAANGQFPVLKDWRVLWPRKDAKPVHCVQGSSEASCQVTLGDWGFCPGGKHAFFTEKRGDGRSEIRRVSMSNPGFSSLVGRTRGTLWKMVCLDAEGRNFLLIDVPIERIRSGVLTSGHPRHVWTLDAKTNVMLRWRGPWEGHLPWTKHQFLSPDGEYVLLQSVHRVAKQTERTFVWYALHLRSRSAIQLSLPPSLHQFRGWDGFDSSLQAMFSTGGVLDEKRIPYLVHPGSGITERVARLPMPLMGDGSVSPDGRWRYQLTRHGVEIVNRSNKQARMFRIPRKERIGFRSGCCQWMGSDHLLFTSPTLGILAIDSLRYATLPNAQSIPHIVEIDDDSGWMFILAGQELSLARSVLPLGTHD